MKRLTFYLFLISSLSIVIACSKDDDQPEGPRTFDDVEADFQAIDLSPGIEDIELELPDGEIYKFRVISPERSNNERRPFILALHGASSSPDAHKNTACYVEPGLESLDAFILSPYAEGGLWFSQTNQNMIGNLMYLTLKHWPIDAGKIAVTGYSNGGNASWLFAKFQASTLSAAIPMASSYDVYELDSTVTKWDVPLYVIHGEEDELFPVEQTREWVEATVAAGSDVTLVVAPGLGHYVPCSYVPYLKDAASWLQNEVWK